MLFWWCLHLCVCVQVAVASKKCANIHMRVHVCTALLASPVTCEGMCCSLDWGLPEVAAACVPVPRKIYLEIQLPLSVYVCPSMDALSLPPCQLAAASMPNTPNPPSAIYVFAQPCDLTLSQATSTLGHITRQAEICPMPCIPLMTHTHRHTLTPPLVTHNSHLAF